MFQNKSFASLVSKLTDICFKKIYISTLWRVIGNFKGEGVLKDKTLLKFSGGEFSLGVGGVWSFSGTTQ